jgi:MYXO-CTERM domain-containing protein
VELVPPGPERTTAATDALLALGALVAIGVLRRRTARSFGRSVWIAALGALALASALGAVAHGFNLAGGTRELLWQPLYLALGVTMALFVVGAVRDWRGERAGRRALGPMLGLAVAFYGVSRLAGGDFLAFVVYEAAALLFALVVYLRLAAGEGRAGAGAMTAALALSLAAGAVQAADVGAVRLLWEFDHNGLFHVVQLVGLVFLVLGLRRLLAFSPRTT